MAVRTFATTTDMDRCTYDHYVELVDNRARLKSRFLIADDVGSVTSRTYELIQGNIKARKTFNLGFADMKTAELVLRIEPLDSDPRQEIPERTLVIQVNRKTIVHICRKENQSFQGNVDAYWSTGWEVIPIPPKALKAGFNNIVIADGSGEGWRLFIDTMRCFGRSAKSIDGGNTWVHETIGAGDFCTGEYVVRLNLERHPTTGTITSPEIDMAVTASENEIADRLIVKSACLKPKLTRPKNTGIIIQWRSGSTPSYRPETWGHWHDTNGAVCVPKSHRFIQWQGTLTTARGDSTPILRGVDVEISATVSKKANRYLNVTDSNNDHLVRSSYPFAHQSKDEPRLEILRERYQLDKVVAGATSEFDTFLLLKRWVRDQWEDGWNRGELQWVPPWDALVVLDLASRQMSLGMCTHYASTFVQCCLALGLQARVCITTAHCVAEIWSKEYRKWVMMDPGCDADDTRKATRHFERSGVPMSAVDLHHAYVEKDFEDIVEICDPAPISGTMEENVSRYYQFCTTTRNNFLTSLYPEETEHGAVSYTYDGHIWYGSETMPLPQFSKTSRRDGDFDWSLNQTHISLQQGSEPNAVTVLLDTVTPNFDTYMLKIDDGRWKKSKERFVWKLAPGENTLQVKSRNSFGVDGIESSLVIRRGRPV